MKIYVAASFAYEDRSKTEARKKKIEEVVERIKRLLPGDTLEGTITNYKVLEVFRNPEEYGNIYALKVRAAGPVEEVTAKLFIYSTESGDPETIKVGILIPDNPK